MWTNFLQRHSDRHERYYSVYHGCGWYRLLGHKAICPDYIYKISCNIFNMPWFSIKTQIGILNVRSVIWSATKFASSACKQNSWPSPLPKHTTNIYITILLQNHAPCIFCEIYKNKKIKDPTCNYVFIGKKA